MRSWERCSPTPEEGSVCAYATSRQPSALSDCSVGACSQAELSPKVMPASPGVECTRVCRDLHAARHSQLGVCRRRR